jgi:hypothetical protein
VFINNPVGGGGSPGTFTFITLTGSITPSQNFGAITYGTLTYNDTNNFGAFETSVNSYGQFVLQNASNGTTASTNYNVSNDQATATTNYAEFGINSSGFTGTGAFSQAGYAYLASATTDLAIGTYGSNAIHFVVNNGATDAMTITSAGVVQVAGNPVSALGSVSALFGSGADGTVTISSGTTTLTRDMMYANLTISGTGSLVTNGYRVFVSGTLTITNAPAAAITSSASAGNNASGATGGTTPSTPTGSWPKLPYIFVTATGGTGSTTTGTAGTQASGAVGTLNLGSPGAGGAGGTGVSAGASGVSAQTTSTNAYNFASFPIDYTIMRLSAGSTPASILSGLYGGGGGQGGGDATNAGGGGGGPGAPASFIQLQARFINRGASTTAAAIQAKGGNGGNGANGVAGTAGGGGGGGGASGGTVIIITEGLLGATATNCIDVSGGTGGTGGNSPSTNKGGTGGTGGGTGAVVIHNLGAATYSSSVPATAGSAATTASTTAGTTGGAGATLQVSL